MQSTIKLTTPYQNFMELWVFKSELGLFKFNDDKLNIFKPKILFKISPDDSRNIHENPTTLNFAKFI